jgi:hypothetical protein
MRRLAFVLISLLAVSAPARAVTIRDIIDLTKAGLGEEVLLALVEVDGGVFQIDNETLTRLKEAGVPERVIVALVRSGRMPPPEAASALMPVEPVMPPAPQIVYVEQPPVTVVHEVAVPVPYYVAVPVPDHRRRGTQVHASDSEPTRPPLGPSLQPDRPNRTDRHAPDSPTYWGVSGTRRPDAWKDRN